MLPERPHFIFVLRQRQMSAQSITSGPCKLAEAVFGAPADQQGRRPRKSITCVNFGNRGDKLVASYHADHAYAFDISGSVDSTAVTGYATHLARDPALSSPGKRARTDASSRCADLGADPVLFIDNRPAESTGEAHEDLAMLLHAHAQQLWQRWMAADLICALVLQQQQQQQHSSATA